MDVSLAIPAFIAGLITFLAPCTLPLVPGYLGFISGVSPQDLQDPEKASGARRRVLLNGVMYVVGFSLVFIALGTVFAAGGLAFAKYRLWISRIGGVFVIIFGLHMMHALKFKWLSFLNADKHLKIPASLKPGHPGSSFLFGSIFAFGWTPCVGPVLGSILVLASTSGTVLQGAFLLFVFSLGLAVPFLALAIAFGSATKFIQALTKHLSIISFIGGLFLVLLGVLLVTDSFALWLAWFYEVFSFINLEEKLLDYL